MLISNFKPGNMYYAWANNLEIREKGECGGALTVTMKFLLDEGLVDAVLSVKKGADLYDAVPVLIDDSKDLISSAGSLHCGTLNLAKTIVKYLKGAKNLKIAVSTKPCDAMTLKEIIKRGGVEENNLILLGVNCGGTILPLEARKIVKNRCKMDPDKVIKEEITRGKFVFESETGQKCAIDIEEIESEGYGRRSNCKRCEINIPSMCDLAFGSWGTMGNFNLSFVEVISSKGAEILEKTYQNGYLSLKPSPPEGIKLRSKIDDFMTSSSKKWQSRTFHVKRDILFSLSDHQEQFSKCIKCFGCREACPICFCKDCTLEFNAPEWIHQGEIPPPLFFHLERMIHMVDSCTNCGQCEDVCPVDIPLSSIWQEVNMKIKDLFQYYPGMNNDKPPISYDFWFSELYHEK